MTYCPRGLPLGKERALFPGASRLPGLCCHDGQLLCSRPWGPSGQGTGLHWGQPHGELDDGGGEKRGRAGGDPSRSQPLTSWAPPAGMAELMQDGGISTQLHTPSGSVCFSYANPRWRLFLRKEVGTWRGTGGGGQRALLLLTLAHSCPLQLFYPRENFGHPSYLRLLCEQVRPRPAGLRGVLCVSGASASEGQ